ncbi:hypothetical protein BU17DRAFT_56580 [Hysterangium stoloniferum]|nr:hypothetical protein BU17DRAFT_56580 [Hysterangium stoloniferum]
MSSNVSKATSAEPAEQNGPLEAYSSKLQTYDSSTNPDKKTEQDGTNSGDDDGEQKDGNNVDHNDTDGKKDEDDKDNKKTEENTVNDDKATRTTTPGSSATVAAAGEWQAIWAPMQSAYYFYNSRTGETTWINPLEAQASTGGSSTSAVATTSTTTTTTTEGETEGEAEASTSSSTTATLYAAAEAAGIDPSLAYLDPSLGLPGSTPAGTFAAKFNARTGAFTRVDARDPSHLSESERAKRMSEVYFDVGAWERELEQRYAEEEATGKKRKRPSKKDLERFKEQKKQKKIAKTAWLRT